MTTSRGADHGPGDGAALVLAAPSLRFNPIDVERFNNDDDPKMSIYPPSAVGEDDDEQRCLLATTTRQRRKPRRSGAGGGGGAGGGARYADRRRAFLDASTRARAGARGGMMSWLEKRRRSTTSGGGAGGPIHRRSALDASTHRVWTRRTTDRGGEHELERLGRERDAAVVARQKRDERREGVLLVASSLPGSTTTTTTNNDMLLQLPPSSASSDMWLAGATTTTAAAAAWSTGISLSAATASRLYRRQQQQRQQPPSTTRGPDSIVFDSHLHRRPGPSPDSGAASRHARPRQTALLRRDERRQAALRARRQGREERSFERRRLGLGQGQEMIWMAGSGGDGRISWGGEKGAVEEEQEEDAQERFADADDDDDDGDDSNYDEASDDDERDYEVEALDRQLGEAVEIGLGSSSPSPLAGLPPFAAAGSSAGRTIKGLPSSHRRSTIVDADAAAQRVDQSAASTATLGRPSVIRGAFSPRSSSVPGVVAESNSRHTKQVRRRAPAPSSEGSGSDSDIARILASRGGTSRSYEDDDVSMGVGSGWSSSAAATDTEETDVDDVDAWISGVVPPSPSPAPRRGAAAAAAGAGPGGAAVAWGRRIVSAGTNAAIGALASSMRAMPLMSRLEGSGDVAMSRGPSSTGSDASMDLVVLDRRTAAVSSGDVALDQADDMSSRSTLTDLRRRRLYEINHVIRFASGRAERDASSVIFVRGGISSRALRVIWMAFFGRGRAPAISQRGASLAAQVYIPPRLSLDAQRQLARRHTQLIRQFNASENARGVTDEALWAILATWTQPGPMRQQLAIEAAERDQRQQAITLEAQYWQYIELERVRQLQVEHRRAMELQQHLREEAILADLARQDRMQSRARNASQDARIWELWEQEARQAAVERLEQREVAAQLLPALDIFESSASHDLHRPESPSGSSLGDAPASPPTSTDDLRSNPPEWSPPRTPSRSSLITRITSALPTLSRRLPSFPASPSRHGRRGFSSSDEFAIDSQLSVEPGHDADNDDLQPPPTPSSWASFRLPSLPSSIPLLSTPRRAASAAPTTPPLPDYATIEYGPRSPPPPPPYNATAGFEIIQAQAEVERIEDDLFADDDDEDDEGEDAARAGSDAWSGSSTWRLPGGIDDATFDENEDGESGGHPGGASRCIIM